MPDNEYGEQKTYKLTTKDKVAKANIEKPQQTEYGNTLSEIEIATRQMQVDPLTGAPITVPGFGSLTTSRSSQLFEATDPGYAQGSMENAMKNPLITGVAQYGLKQKEEFDPVKADKNNNGVVEDWEKASVKSFTK